MFSTVREKQSVRRKLAARRRQFDPTVARRLSAHICTRLLKLREVKAAESLSLYAALPGEVELSALVQSCRKRGQITLLPRFNSQAAAYEMVPCRDLVTETARGRFGIREPLPSLPALPAAQLLSPKMTWLVPGLGFDRAGHRLGRGKGFYDQLLSAARGPRIGVAFNWQVLPEIPVETHDMRMDLVVTEKGVFQAGAGRPLFAAPVARRRTSRPAAPSPARGLRSSGIKR